MGNGLANIIAAVIVAAAILFNGALDGRRKATVADVPGASEDEFREWYARAVGDIKNDIVVNCGCCGEGEKKPGF